MPRTDRQTSRIPTKLRNYMVKHVANTLFYPNPGETAKRDEPARRQPASRARRTHGARTPAEPVRPASPTARHTGSTPRPGSWPGLPRLVCACGVRPPRPRAASPVRHALFHRFIFQYHSLFTARRCFGRHRTVREPSPHRGLPRGGGLGPRDAQSQCGQCHLGPAQPGTAHGP